MPFCERVTLTPDSKIRDLRRGCKWIGISEPRPKAAVKVFERIIHTYNIAIKRDRWGEVAMQLYPDEVHEPEMAEVARQAAAREPALHEVTRIPFRPWCQHCVAGSRGADDASVADPEHAAQADSFPFEERGRMSPSASSSWSMFLRYVHAKPWKVRNRNNVGEAMARFLGNLHRLL